MSKVLYHHTDAYKPHISIIVPVYNVGSYIEDCINSVMRQTYDGPIECILVDDCGKDESMEIAESLISRYEGPIVFHVLHHAHNLGLSEARNTGISHAIGDYLFFLDSDDEITNDCLEKLARPVFTERCDLVIGDFDRLKRLPSGHWRTVDSKDKLKLPNAAHLIQPSVLRTHRKCWNAMAWNKLYKTSFISSYGLRFKAGLLYEDNLWGFQVACVASSLVAVNEITYYWKERSGSIVNSPNSDREMAESTRESIKEMSIFVEKYGISHIEAFPFFSSFFSIVLQSLATSEHQFVILYRELRPYFKAPLLGIIQKDRFRVKNYLQDFHYLLPKWMAPYWHYFICRRVRHFLKMRF